MNYRDKFWRSLAECQGDDIIESSTYCSLLNSNLNSSWYKLEFLYIKLIYVHWSKTWFTSTEVFPFFVKLFLTLIYGSSQSEVGLWQTCSGAKVNKTRRLGPANSSCSGAFGSSPTGCMCIIMMYYVCL